MKIATLVLVLASAAPFCWAASAKTKKADDSAPLAMNLGALKVTEAGESPNKTITVESPGRYRLVVYEATGGGITEFYDLTSDPDARRNVAWPDRGLFDIGWHGNPVTHDWPTQANWRQSLGATAKVEITERSEVRTRIRIETNFTHWGKLIDKDMPLIVTYTFYPAGQMYAQVRVQRLVGQYGWSHEYGPHIAVSASKTDPLLNSDFVFSAPKTAEMQDSDRLSPLEELVLITSPKVPTAMFVTIPIEEETIFTGVFRHNGRSVSWDRAGFGSARLVMAAGFDHTWSCLLQLGSKEIPGVPKMSNAEEALPYAMQYRIPPRITPAIQFTEDDGDANKDGYNEADGSIVLKGSSKLNFELNRGPCASYCPVFKILDWSGPKAVKGKPKPAGKKRGPAPSKIKINDQDVPVLSAIVDGNLIVQVQAQLMKQVNKISFGDK